MGYLPPCLRCQAVSRTEQVNPPRRGGLMSKLKVFFSFKLLHGSFVSVVPVINLKPKKGWTVVGHLVTIT